MSRKLLIVDDEETLCEALRFNFEAEGYEVATANSAEEVLSMDISDCDLILLDIMMGDISGTQLAKILKSNPATASIPIIFCTAKDAEDDMVDGLELGADDYIVKPYTLRNVMARVRAVLRRTVAAPAPSRPDDPDKVSYEGLTVIPSRKLCLVDGEEVRLPRKDEVVVLDRVVDVNITRIRQKIGRYGSHIKTRSGYGYGFMD